MPNQTEIVETSDVVEQVADDDTAAGAESVQVDLLVEDVSIDGMCGVY